MDEARTDEPQPAEPEQATEAGEVQPEAEPEPEPRAQPEPGAEPEQATEAGEAQPEAEPEVANMTGAEMFAQLQVMASQIIDDAPPTVREAAARAAELAASAARTAGPAAQRAADFGGDAAERFANRSDTSPLTCVTLQLRLDVPELRETSLDCPGSRGDASSGLTL